MSTYGEVQLLVLSTRSVSCE